MPLRIRTAPPMFLNVEAAPPQFAMVWLLARSVNVPRLLSFDASPKQGSPSFQLVAPLRFSVFPLRSCGLPAIVNLAVLANVDVVTPLRAPPFHNQSPVTVNAPVVVLDCIHRWGMLWPAKITFSLTTSSPSPVTVPAVANFRV